MILPQTIDEIFNATRVEEVIGDFVNLKKSGSSLKGLSPFGDEKSPSFMVSPTKQIWKDFSSGKGGNAVSFLMEHEQFSYPEALRWLAKRYNIEIKEDVRIDPKQDEEKKHRETIYQITEFAVNYFAKQLEETKEGKVIGKAYFKERGFSDEIIKTFKLGYSPKQFDAFSTYARKNGYTEKEITNSGLGIKKEESNNFVDRFRERVMFPIFSFSGRAVGFGARILNSEIKTAKYLNSPESEIYHKSKLLYGFFQAKNEIRKRDQCILVEGYTDVLSFYQKGAKNVVASSGTSLTPEQIRLIKRLTENILLIYDGDSAGIKASFRGIDLLLEQGMNIEVLRLPLGEDPDSFAKQNDPESLEKYLRTQATDFIRFKASILQEEAGDNPTKKANTVNELIHSISIIESLVKRELYIRETASILKIQEKVLFGALAQKLAKDKQEVDKRSAYNPPTPLTVVKKEEDLIQDSWLKIEHDIIQMLLDYGDQKIEWKQEDSEEMLVQSIGELVISEFEKDEIALRHSFYQKMFDDFKTNINTEEYKKTGAFSQLMDEETAKTVADMMMEKHSLSDWESKGISITPREEKSPQLAVDLIYSYKLITLEDMIEQEAKNIDEESRDEKMQQIMKLIELRKIFKSKLNRVV